MYPYIYIYIYIKDVRRYTKIIKNYRTGAGGEPGRAARPPLGIFYILVYLCISWISLEICLVYSKMELSGPMAGTF